MFDKLLSSVPGFPIFQKPNLQKLHHKHKTLTAQLTTLQTRLQETTAKHEKAEQTRTYNHDIETPSKEAKRLIQEIKETSTLKTKIANVQGEIREVQAVIEYLTNKKREKDARVAKKEEEITLENPFEDPAPDSAFSEKSTLVIVDHSASTRETRRLERSFEIGKRHYEDVLRQIRNDEKALKDARWTAFQDEEKLDKRCFRCDVCLDQIAKAERSHEMAHEAEDVMRETIKALDRAEKEMKDAELRVTRVGGHGRELEDEGCWSDS
ncbi:hypothetical protein HYALB_00007787 [Hymenoscyphus albidus]|uniref:Uncharacterized protein n=1 Tax=Hymenoscyphus albidus TaxID=595503 RepID=A0A9N9LNE1_9HELO|nr:hypothetical protein HYALB_00007787 [Hymenoscyphus albidus]